MKLDIQPGTAEDIAHFGRLLQYNPGPDMTAVKCVDADTNRILACAGYDNWTVSAVDGHIWVGDPRALAGRRFLREIFAYPFVQCGRTLIVGRTPASNEASLEFQRRVGFEDLFRIPDGWDIGVDMVFTVMHRDRCPWLRSAK